MQDIEPGNTTTGKFSRHGFAGWLLRNWNARAMRRNGREMRLLETLSLGGKRQLMLVRCGEEQFLVGGGVESVTAIVKVSGLERLEDGRCI